MRLRDKVAIVFGAGPNIGGTVATYFAREGARVVVSDVSLRAAESTVAHIESIGGKACAAQGDVMVEADVERIVRTAVDRYGRLDVAFNLAGIVHWGSILDMELEAFERGVKSFPIAGMLTTKHSARAIKAQGHGGSIIHLLSTAAHFGEAGASAYTAAKAGLLSLARSAAMDLAHDGIRVNTITPCGMEHQLWTHTADEVDENFVRPRRASFYSRDDYLKMIPLERFPRASDLAWAAVFLASDEASFLTGVDIPIDGGLRFKYPTWRPGDFTGVNIGDYIDNTSVTEYGEPARKLKA